MLSLFRNLSFAAFVGLGLVIGGFVIAAASTPAGAASGTCYRTQAGWWFCR